MNSIRSCKLPDQDRARGFSLVELMVTLVVFAVVAGAITLVFINSAQNKERTAHLLEAQQGARAAMDLMARDIRKKIEEEMEYPGHIKVLVVRETRAIEFAK